MKPKVIEASEVRALASRRKQKSDSRDAADMADGIRRGIYCKIVYVPEKKIERLRRVLSQRGPTARLPATAQGRHRSDRT